MLQGLTKVERRCWTVACVGLGISFGFLAGQRVRFPGVPSASDHEAQQPSPLPLALKNAEATNPTAPLFIPARIRFSGGVACEGRKEEVPASHWDVTCNSMSLPVFGDTPLRVELPQYLVAANPSHFAIQVAGWCRADLKMPTFDNQGEGLISSLIVLRREMTGIVLNMPS